jgi:hypothetical protein
MLICMQISTSIRVSRATHAELAELAAAEHVTLDALLRRLARHERQRRIGAALAAHQPTAADEQVMHAGRTTVARHARR